VVAVPGRVATEAPSRRISREEYSLVFIHVSEAVCVAESVVQLSTPIGEGAISGMV
jgi:hypothetical protein